MTDPEEKNSAIYYSLQLGHTSPIRARVTLLAQMLEEASFDQLRTKEQLGYLVQASMKEQAGQLYLYLLVQSDRATPGYLESRIEAHLVDFIDNLQEDYFERLRIATIAKLQEKPATLNEEFFRYWQRLDDGDFGRAKEDAGFLKGETFQGFLEFYHSLVDPRSINTRAGKLSIHAHPVALSASRLVEVVGEKTSSLLGKNQVIKNPTEFKSLLELGPAVTPINNK